MSSDPRTATFLFTDLENSRPLWEDRPRLMRELSSRHDALIGTAIEAHRGRVVKTTGDGFDAVFRVAKDGAEAALAGQQAIIGESWPAETGPLTVRMGLHTGESRERDGDYYGSEVNRAGSSLYPRRSYAADTLIVVTATQRGGRIGPDPRFRRGPTRPHPRKKPVPMQHSAIGGRSGTKRSAQPS